MKTLIIFFYFFTTLFCGMSFSQETWSPTTLNNSPENRAWHTAVWTGSKLIIWGGQSNYWDLNTGGVYDLNLNTWVQTTLINAPSKRQIHTAIWTGSKMIIWGGMCFTCGDTFMLNTGGIYDPANNSWETISTQNAPSARSYHTAVWTGNKMIIWGGAGDNTGGIYDPETNTWDSTTTLNAPSARYWHTAIWTGSKMIIWGGDSLNDDLVNTGGIYDPITNSWSPTSTYNAPSPRIEHTAIWTGSEMIIWGGSFLNFDKSGGKYNPVSDSWVPTEFTNAPDPRFCHIAVWSGRKMMIWGGLTTIGTQSYAINSGGIYDPINNTWLPTTVSGAPLRRYLHEAVWTGEKIIIWGGLYENGPINSGGIYSNPNIIGIQNTNENAPGNFSLSQNYPNPFNPVTNIKFNIPLSRGVSDGRGVFVKLIVYDMLGREITTLVNQQMQAGSYSIDWDASNYPSGVYFYKLEIDNYVESKKMVLVK